MALLSNLLGSTFQGAPGPGNGVFPFYKADGNTSNVALINFSSIPFFKANGVQDNIDLVSS